MSSTISADAVATVIVIVSSASSSVPTTVRGLPADEVINNMSLAVVAEDDTVAVPFIDIVTNEINDVPSDPTTSKDIPNTFPLEDASITSTFWLLLSAPIVEIPAGLICIPLLAVISFKLASEPDNIIFFQFAAIILYYYILIHIILTRILKKNHYLNYKITPPLLLLGLY